MRRHGGGGSIQGMTVDLLAAVDSPVCPACGYDLRGIASERCPECGAAIDRVAVSRVPWVHRRAVGRMGAYWRTLCMATFRTATLAAEVRRPISVRDGQTFRWATLALAWPPLAVAAWWAAGRVPWAEGVRSALEYHLAVASSVGWPINLPTDALPLGLTVPWAVGVDTVGVAPLAVGGLLVLLTGVGSYLFRPARMPPRWRGRAVAISYFACAPLAATVVPVLAGGLLAGENADFTATGPLWVWPRGFHLLLQIVLFGCPLLILAGTWLATVRLMRSATLSGWPGTAWRAAALTALWAASAVLAFVGVPWVVGYARLMVGALTR